MAKVNQGVSCLMVVMMVCCSLGAVKAAVHTVGDSSGWSMSGDYSTWAADKTFNVGDTLLFNYSPGHTVDEVSEGDYKSCTTGNAIASDSSGATSITLKTAGDHYFICGVSGHCTGGMKLAVNTVAAAAAPSTGGEALASSPATILPPASSPDNTLPPASSPATGTTNLPPTDAAISPASGTTVTTTTTPSFAPPTAIRTSPTSTVSQPSSATSSSPVAIVFAFCGVMMIQHFVN